MVGFAAVFGVLISTWWVPGFRITLLAGVPWLAILTVCYLVWRKVRPDLRVRGESHDG